MHTLELVKQNFVYLLMICLLKENSLVEVIPFQKTFKSTTKLLL